MIMDILGKELMARKSKTHQKYDGGYTRILCEKEG